MRIQKKTENREAQRERTLPILPGIIVITLLSVALFVGSFLVMGKLDIITLPESIDALINGSSGHEETNTNKWEEFLASIGGKRSEFEFSGGELSGVSLDSIFKRGGATSYFQLYSLKVRTDGTESSCEISALRSEDKVRFDSYRGDELTKSVICDGKDIKLADGNGSRTYHEGDSFFAAFSPESEIGIPSPSELMARLRGYENDGYSVSLEHDGGNNIFRITCTSDEISEIYDIKAEDGIILSCRLYLTGDVLPYYELKTTALITDVRYSDDQFATD